MKKINIAVVDSSENFALQIHDKLKEKTGDNSEVFIITQKEYLEEFFSKQQKIDVLLIDNKFYSEAVEKHDIDLICILQDTPDACRETKKGFIYNVYRGSGAEKITETMLSAINPAQYSDDVGTDGCKIVLVTSPIGGSGKTLIASAVAHCLKKNGMRVLFADTTCFQSASYWTKSENSLSDDFVLDNFRADSSEKIVLQGSVDHLAFFNQALPALSINAKDYYEIIKAQKKKNNYDYIVVDSESCFTDGLINIMSVADHVVIPVLQDEISAFKIQKFVQNFDCSDTAKYLFCYNKFRADKRNYLKSQTSILPVDFYIPMFEPNGSLISDVCQMKGIYRIVSRLF